ncbi:MAG: adenylate/guanylate cyclase domain-containing protein, partial [Spirochaetota bacterium]
IKYQKLRSIDMNQIAFDIPRDEKKARILTRIALLVSIFIAIVAGTLAGTRGAYYAVIINYLGIVIYGILFWLHWNSKVLLARLAFLLIANIHLLVILLFVGRELGAWVHFILLMLVPFAIFARKQRKFILPMSFLAFAMLIGTYVIFEIFQFQPIISWERGIKNSRVLVNLTLVSIGSILLMRFLRNVQFQAEDRLEEEHRRSEDLLLNVLPASIAERLKNGEQPIADLLGEVTILFADIVGFTRFAGKSSPRELIDLLNEIFTEFDRLADKYRLEKIKTIGDCYMVVAGLPEPVEKHAIIACRMAFEMQKFIHDGLAKGKHELQIRIGLHSGSVIAGVIGTKKFSYDLWGDAVNTASRMESNGTPGEITVTSETYTLVREEFEGIRREPIEIKGKGVMTTWYLKQKKEKQT